MTLKKELLIFTKVSSVKLTSITINNLFSYHGINTIEFDNITCIIGTNGFGKTSILNSIKLCLGQSNIDINSILNNNATEKNVP